MNMLSALRARLRAYPAPTDTPAVRDMIVTQWSGIAARAPSYLEGYRDRPGSQSRSQRRAEWLAGLPVFRDAESVLEVGCACGRNLAALRRQHPLQVIGADLSVEALAEARRILPAGDFRRLDAHEAASWPAAMQADVVLTCGVLIHLHPDLIPGIVRALADRALRAVVFCEEWNGCGARVLKGPRSWNPALKPTGDYVAWSVSQVDVADALEATGRVRSVVIEEVPEALQTIGARKVVVVWLTT